MRTIFLSVGATANDAQEQFVKAVEDRLNSEGLIPRTVGRNTFSCDAPLRAVTELMDQCDGAVIVALERMYFPEGFDKRGGPKETRLSEIRLPTPWNQIEAAMAYSRRLPLLVIVESGLKSEGLLERGYDWYVQWVEAVPASLHTLEFNGVLSNWKSKVDTFKAREADVAKSYGDFTIRDLITGLKPAQLWSIISAIAALAGGAFALGVKLANYS
jgi:hypothetical protein